ncbi:50S ribosomal protein L9 [Desulfobulbus alkaliphilus]|uniref:50S ribosomal protein L9 n=1 Tax=Desulfobulbus alkaliphilus TaxID=869814 RepID=UPI0019650F98|nr:50S ribosomal protein L9 [Desulfobulbus alkaliphilus]MBM9537172.1 50S ribosomal protein L9 [Desulfobulbus alkaliphilus]
MDIILKETIETLGQEGDVVKVRPGYARNFLIPKQKAVQVSKASLANLEREKQLIASRLAEQKKQAEKLAAKLHDKVVTIAKRVGDENRLFGSVTSADIAAALQEAGTDVDRKTIVLTDAIKAIGEYKVAVKTGYQTTATILVQVVPEDMTPIQ